MRGRIKTANASKTFILVSSIVIKLQGRMVDGSGEDYVRQLVGYTGGHSI